MIFLDQQQRLRPTADAWVRIGLREVTQICASFLLFFFRWLRHGVPSQPICLSSFLSLLGPSHFVPIRLDDRTALGERIPDC